MQFQAGQRVQIEKTICMLYHRLGLGLGSKILKSNA